MYIGYELDIHKMRKSSKLGSGMHCKRITCKKSIFRVRHVLDIIWMHKHTTNGGMACIGHALDALNLFQGAWHAMEMRCMQYHYEWRTGMHCTCIRCNKTMDWILASIRHVLHAKTHYEWGLACI